MVLGGVALPVAGLSWAEGLPALQVESVSHGAEVRGVVSGELPFEFERTRALLASPVAWCDIVLLHFNVKACVPGTDRGHARLSVYHGGKRSLGAEEGAALRYSFAVETRASRLAVMLRADRGSLGTRDHRLRLVASPAGAARTAVRFDYAFEASGWARQVLRAYLATAGRHKCGFSVVEDDGERHCVRGVRGILERNAVRYYYAMIAVLEGQAAAPGDAAWRARRWFDLTETQPRQLREMSREEYLATKLPQLAEHDAARAAP